MSAQSALNAVAVRVECISSPAALDGLKDAWVALESRDPDCTPFNTWDWVSLWWQHYGEGAELAILVVRQADRVVAIAPFYRRREAVLRLLSRTVLRFIGAGGDTSPDYLNILALPGYRDLAEQRVVAYLFGDDDDASNAMPAWECLRLTEMRESSSLVARLQQRLDQATGVTLDEPVNIILQAELPATFDEWRMALSRKRRKQINHRRNRLDAAGTSTLTICQTDEEAADATDALIALHRLRWQSKGEVGSFRTEAYEQFHRDVISRFHARGELWLATLELDDAIIGVQYIYHWRKQLMFFQSGYSPDHEPLSPGHVLFTWVIDEAIKQGLDRIDMLKGDYSYKSVYAKEEHRTVGVQYLKPGIHAVIGRSRRTLKRLLTACRAHAR